MRLETRGGRFCFKPCRRRLCWYHVNPRIGKPKLREDTKYDLEKVDHEGKRDGRVLLATRIKASTAEGRCYLSLLIGFRRTKERKERKVRTRRLLFSEAAPPPKRNPCPFVSWTSIHTHALPRKKPSTVFAAGDKPYLHHKHSETHPLVSRKKQRTKTMTSIDRTYFLAHNTSR